MSISVLPDDPEVPTGMSAAGYRRPLWFGPDWQSAAVPPVPHPDNAWSAVERVRGTVDDRKLFTSSYGSDHTVDENETESFEVPSRSGDAKRCTAIARDGSNDLPFFGQGSAAHLTCSCRWASAEAHSRRRIASPLKGFKLPRR